MADTGRFKIEGWLALNKQLEELDGVTHLRTIRSAARYAMKPVHQKAVRRAPVGDKFHQTYLKRMVAPGFLSRSIVIRTKLWKEKHGVSVMVAFLREAFYAEFLEFGKNRDHNQAPRPWFSNLLEDNADEVMDRFGKQLQKRINKIKSDAKKKQ